MKRRSLMIFVFLSLVFLSPLFVIGSDPYDNDSWREFPIDIEIGGHRFVKVEWENKGDLIYSYIEVTQGKVRFYFIDNQDYEDITNVAVTWDENPVFSKLVETDFEYNITLPYEGPFYFWMVHHPPGPDVKMNGWYARDETKPFGEMWGINTNFADEVLIGSTADPSCVFTDRFGLSEITLYENEAVVQTINVTGLVEHYWTKGSYKFTTLGEIEIKFEAIDQGGNIGTASKTVKVVNKLSPKPITSIPEYFDWVGFFEDYWFIMIPVGTLLGIAVMFGLEKAGKLH